MQRRLFQILLQQQQNNAGFMWQKKRHIWFLKRYQDHQLASKHISESCIMKEKSIFETYICNWMSTKWRYLSKYWNEQSLTRRTMMPEYNIAVAYWALKPPCLDSEQNQNKIIQPKKFPRKRCQTTISNKLSGAHGHRLKCSTFRPSADSKLEPATNVFLLQEKRFH